jgi:hypothetical protein
MQRYNISGKNIQLIMVLLCYIDKELRFPDYDRLCIIDY